MAVYEIPLTPNSQTFAVALAGVTYNIYLFWNGTNSTWMINISDASNNLLIGGIPLVTGCDLLAQYEYMNFGGQLVVQTDNDPDVLPTISNLGSTSHLYFVTTS